MSNLSHTDIHLNKDQIQLHLKRKNHSCLKEHNQRNKIEFVKNKSRKQKKKNRNKYMFLQKNQENLDV